MNPDRHDVENAIPWPEVSGIALLTRETEKCELRPSANGNNARCQNNSRILVRIQAKPIAPFDAPGCGDFRNLGGRRVIRNSC
jgi:hypothetical protein